MSKDPDERFATTEAFATAVWPEQPVVAAQGGRPGTRPPPRPRISPDAPTEVSAAATTPLPAALGGPPPSRRPQLKRKSKVPLVVGSAVVAAAGLGGYLMLGRGTRASHEPLAAHVDTVRVQDTVTVQASSPPPPRTPSPRPPVAAPPAAALGYITVNAEPYGELYVDGVDVGPTPVVRYGVPAGVHTIKVVREGFKTVGEKVQVDAGNTVPKRYTLLPGG
jgi:hypothetical protein